MNNQNPRKLVLAVVLLIIGFVFQSRYLHANEMEIDFDSEIVPILTKAGCNSGACHGAAAGRGEFHLSLFGSDAEFDYEEIVRAFRGRRVNLAQPDASLLLAKPTEVISHGGGTRLEYEGKEATLLEKWIEQGARRIESRKLVSFKIETDKPLLQTEQQISKIKSIARFDDGTTRDVTEVTVFTPEDPGSVEIDEEAKTARLLRPGRHVIIARYLDQVVPIVLIRPLHEFSIDPSTLPANNFIDESINLLLVELGIPPSPEANDSVFLRRATLDFVGRLPTLSEVAEFHKDTSDAKREHLIERLLASDDFIDFWTFQYAQLLRIKSQPKDTLGAETYHAWLKNQIRERTPFDEVAKSLVLADGDSHAHGPANFYRTVGGPREQAEFFSELFLGSRLRCANCHDHPLDHWKQDDYHGLAAIFAKVESGKVVRIKETAEVFHPKTGDPAQPRIPGLRDLPHNGDRREELAAWMIDSENPYFAKTVVNRLWKELMGRGLIDPTDDLRTTNPATHPKLLDELATEFIASGYQIRHVLKLIGTSAAYNRSERILPENKADDRFYSHALIRPLKPEVLADALAAVTGVSTQYGEQPVGTLAVTLVDPKTPSPALDVLGRCDREESCEGGTGASGGLPRMLHQFNGGLINDRLASSESRLSSLIDKDKKPMEIVEVFYQLAFSRMPTPQEQAFWQSQFGENDSAEKTRAILEDFVWSLCTSKEFLTNH